MKIENARYKYIDQHPVLFVDIDGKEALIADFKYSILEIGYVPLASRDPNVDWNKILPKVNIPATENHFEVTLTGATSNAVILSLAEEYWKTINWVDGREFKEGPVEMPVRTLLNSE